MEGYQALGQEILLPTSSTGISAPLLKRKSFTGTASAGDATTITLVANTAMGTAIEGFFDKCKIKIIAGTGVNQERVITGHVGSTRVCTVPTWATNPDNTSVYAISHDLDGMQAQMALVYVEDNAINYCVNGSVPTVSTGTNIGVYADVNSEPIELCGPNEVKNFRCIDRVGGAASKVKIVTFA